ncbi:hypothetical protein U27_06704 [Candidatus Vecturithrix granuli]|uniref:DinB-like domain-containing protein n=1 Tax=Vecturithrix granuli TaxID=1499967 RepID=A0A081C564_VECG1|nr:hypothetical protein U27_06704 [Candidatus Vecturithrix granuli]
MFRDGLIMELQTMRQFFLNSTSCLTEADSSFAPTPEMFTAAQQVAHAALTIDWFMDGAFGKEFDMDFEQQMAEIKKFTSLQQALANFEKAIERAILTVRESSDEELMSPLPAGPIMGGAPKAAVISAMADHTAHHRGALTVYSRLLGKVPPMPYGEM